MEALFDEIERALADDPFRIDAEFDPTTGAVVSYFVDLDEMIATSKPAGAGAAPSLRSCRKG